MDIKHSLKLAQDVVSRAAEQKQHVSVAVVDRGGALVAFARSDVAALVTVDTAIGKAYTAVMMGADSSALHAITQPGQPLAGFQAMTLYPRPLVPFAGGVVMRDGTGEMIGGIGVSGCETSELDEQIAQHALKTIERQLA